jgi:hypothetical protein
MSSYQKPPLPAAYTCCITSELMNDPVITDDGQTYERAAIERWLREHDTSPRTNERLANKRLIPNIALRQQISDFRNEHGYSPPRPYHPPRYRPRGMVQQRNDEVDACPSVPGWAVASVFLAVWLTAWAAGEVTVAKEVIAAFHDGDLSFATLFTIVWLGAWSFGGCIACSAMYGLCCRECFPREEGEDQPLFGGGGAAPVSIVVQQPQQQGVPETTVV